jgi:hypothetical protein
MKVMNTILVGPKFEASLDEAKKSKKIKTVFCKGCQWDDRCDGIWCNYEKIFGDEDIKKARAGSSL